MNDCKDNHLGYWNFPYKNIEEYPGVKEYTNIAYRVNELFNEIVCSSKGEGTELSVTKDDQTVTLLIKKASTFVLNSIFECRDRLGFVTSVEDGAVKVVFVPEDKV